jgi:hypothetical protein
MDLSTKLNEPERNELEFQGWLVEQLGGLLSAAEMLPLPPTKEKVKEIISNCIMRVSDGNIQHFINKIAGVKESTTKQWLYGSIRPSMTALMAVCFQSAVPVKEIILGRYDQGTPKSEIIDRGGSVFFSPHALEAMKTKIVAMLDEKPPPGVRTVAKRIGCNISTINLHFPKLYSELKKKTTSYREEKYNTVKIKKELEIAMAESPAPSLCEVANRLYCSRTFLRDHFPEECDIIVERYAIHKKRYVSLEEIDKELIELLKRSPPISQRECAELVGYSLDSLRRLFPELYKKISDRFKKYKHRESLKANKEKEREVRKSIKFLRNAGIKVTSYRIKQHFPHLSNMYNREIEAIICKSHN